MGRVSMMMIVVPVVLVMRLFFFIVVQVVGDSFHHWNLTGPSAKLSEKGHCHRAEHIEGRAHRA